MRAVKFVAGGEAIDLSAFLTEEEEPEDESVKAASAAAAVADELTSEK